MEPRRTGIVAATQRGAAVRIFALRHEGQLSLAASFSWTFVGRLVYVAAQWGILAALAKLGSPEMVGLFSLGLAVTTPIIMLSMLQLRSVQVTDAQQEYEFGHYLALRLTTSMIALVVIGIVTAAAGYRDEAALVILALGLFKVIESISDGYHGLMQRQHRMDKASAALIIKGPLFLLASVAVIHLTGSVVWSVTAILLIALTLLITYELPVAKQLLHAAPGSVRPIWEWHRLGQLARLAAPLGIVMMLIALNTNIPRYFIESRHGVRELGFFTALVYPEAAGAMIVTALGQAASPKLAEFYAAGRVRDFVILLGRMTGAGLVVGAAALLAAIAFGPEILTVLYGPAYAEYSPLFGWLMGAAALSFIGSFLGYGMTAARVFKVQVPLFSACAALNTVACLLLIPQRGLLGAAQALALTAMAGIAGSAAITFWAIKRRRTDD